MPQQGRLAGARSPENSADAAPIDKIAQTIEGAHDMRRREKLIGIEILTERQ